MAFSTSNSVTKPFKDGVAAASEEEELGMLAMLLGSAATLPMSLKAAIELDVLEIIARAGPGAHLSATQISSQIPTKNPDATVTLDRMLRLLASHSILTCCLSTGADGSTEERLYGLAPVCKFLTRNEDGVSIAPLLVDHHDKVFMDAWQQLKDVVLEGGFPFDRAHGMHQFDYLATDPRLNTHFNKAMLSHTGVVMKKILEKYKGFEGLKELVDVGGGIGAALSMIVSKYPNIKGINYDLPHVIAEAPAYNGLEHRGGDMFASVPSAEAIFMKSLLHDWSDELCLKILKNCYKALPDNGKLILVELILPSEPEESLYAKYVFQLDMIVLTHNHGGKERSVKEFEKLVKGAGFASLKPVCCAYGSWVIECYKKV